MRDGGYSLEMFKVHGSVIVCLKSRFIWYSLILVGGGY